MNLYPLLFALLLLQPPASSEQPFPTSNRTEVGSYPNAQAAAALPLDGQPALVAFASANAISSDWTVITFHRQGLGWRVRMSEGSKFPDGGGQVRSSVSSPGKCPELSQGLGGIVPGASRSPIVGQPPVTDYSTYDIWVSSVANLPRDPGDVRSDEVRLSDILHAVAECLDRR